MDALKTEWAGRKRLKQLASLLPAVLLLGSCAESSTKTRSSAGTSGGSLVRQDKKALTYPGALKSDSANQISQYIRRIVRDRKGNLWFATNSDGVARYNWDSLTYFTPKEGLAGAAVRSILEDRNGNLWFATIGGVSRYDGTSFTNFTAEDGLSGNDAWSITEDNNGHLWFGTSEGICRYDGKSFTPVRIPFAKIENPSYRVAPALAWYILKDRNGNIWFGTDGLGIYKYDGTSFTAFSEKDGLCDDNITCIVEDRKGNLWFSSWAGGVSRYDGTSFTNFTTREGLNSNRVWSMFEDTAGNMWFTTEGVDRFDGTSFTHFGQKDGLSNPSVQSIFEDEGGKFWFGTGAGLFRYDGRSFTNITKSGPWY